MKQQLHKKAFIDRCFKDEHNKVVIAQRPNIPILIFIVFFVLSKLASSTYLQDVFSTLSTLFLFAWAWLEISLGVNYFRRALGATVIAIILFGIVR